MQFIRDRVREAVAKISPTPVPPAQPSYRFRWLYFLTGERAS